MSLDEQLVSDELPFQLLTCGVVADVPSPRPMVRDRLTILFQVHSMVTTKQHAPQYADSILAGIKKVVGKEGYLAFWKGASGVCGGALGRGGGKRLAALWTTSSAPEASSFGGARMLSLLACAPHLLGPLLSCCSSWPRQAMARRWCTGSRTPLLTSTRTRKSRLHSAPSPWPRRKAAVAAVAALAGGRG